MASDPILEPVRRALVIKFGLRDSDATALLSVSLAADQEFEVLDNEAVAIVRSVQNEHAKSGMPIPPPPARLLELKATNRRLMNDLPAKLNAALFKNGVASIKTYISRQEVNGASEAR